MRVLENWDVGSLYPNLVRLYGYSMVKLTNDNGVSQELRVDYLVAKAFVPNPHNYKNIKHIEIK